MPLRPRACSATPSSRQSGVSCQPRRRLPPSCRKPSRSGLWLPNWARGLVALSPRCSVCCSCSAASKPPAAQPRPALSWPWRPLPAVSRTLCCRPGRPRWVNTCTTPPTASLPYSADIGPRTTSMRSIASSGRLSSDGVPTVADPTRTPSTSSRVWRASSPRKNSDEVLPSPPLLLDWMPGSCASTSDKVRPALRSSMARSMTDTSAARAPTRSGRRSAVTSTGSWVCAWAARLDTASATKQRRTGTAARSGRKDNEERTMKGNTPDKAPAPASPQGQTDCARPQARAPCWPVSGLTETTPVAFPTVGTASGVRHRSGGLAPRGIGHVRLPLRGQRRLGGGPWGHRLPASRLTWPSRGAARAPTPQILTQPLWRPADTAAPGAQGGHPPPDTYNRPLLPEAAPAHVKTR